MRTIVNGKQNKQSAFTSNIQQVGLALAVTVIPTFFAACAAERIIAPPKNGAVITRPLKLSPSEAVDPVQRQFISDILEGVRQQKFPFTLKQKGGYSTVVAKGWISGYPGADVPIEGMRDLGWKEVVINVPKKQSEMLTIDVILNKTITLTPNTAFGIGSEINSRILIPVGSARYGGCDDFVYLPAEEDPDNKLPRVRGLRFICIHTLKNNERKYE